MVTDVSKCLIDGSGEKCSCPYDSKWSNFFNVRPKIKNENLRLFDYVYSRVFMNIVCDRR